MLFHSLLSSLLSSLVLLAAVTSAQPPSPPVPSPARPNPFFSWATIPRAFHGANQSGLFTAAAVKELASYQMVTLEKWYTPCAATHQPPSAYSPACDVEAAMWTTFHELKALNPSLSTMLYWNSMFNFPFYAANGVVEALEASGQRVLLRDMHGAIVTLCNDGDAYCGMTFWDHSLELARNVWVQVVMNATRDGPIEGIFADHADQLITPGPHGIATLCNGTPRQCFNFTNAFAAQFNAGHSWVVNYTQDLLARLPGAGAVILGPWGRYETSACSYRELRQAAEAGLDGRGPFVIEANKGGCTPDESCLANFLAAAEEHTYLACFADTPPVQLPEYTFALGPPTGPPQEAGGIVTRSFLGPLGVTHVRVDVASGSGTVAWAGHAPSPSPTPAPPLPPACGRVLTNTAVAMHDVAVHDGVTSPGACCDLCLANAACVIWCYHGEPGVQHDQCHLHSAEGELHPLAGATSGRRAPSGTTGNNTGAAAAAPSSVAITGDVSAPSPGGTPNVWQYWTTWAPQQFAAPAPPGFVLPPYLRWVEIFTATGGCYEGFPGCSLSRDLLNDPTDASSAVNVSNLITPIRNLRAVGLLPHIVTGNVPISFSSPPVIGGFGVNAALPVNLTRYREYLRDVAAALVAEFGAADVAKWRWGCYTEYNNQDWLHATPTEFAALYDYTVCGLEDTLGVGAVDMSVHACVQCGGGSWDPLVFLDHVATGTSACRTGAPVHKPHLGNSFYEHTAGDPGTLAAFAPQGLAVLARAQALGLPHARYGIDEGRLLWGPEGPKYALTTRAVGDAYQGSFDALFFSLLANAVPASAEGDGAYYSRWGSTTLGADLFVPASYAAATVAANVAELCYRLAGGALVPVTNTSTGGGGDPASIVSGAVAAGRDGVLRVLVFHHHPLLNASLVPPAEAAVALCGLPAAAPRGPVAGATEQHVDDAHANAWPAWRAAAAAANLSYAEGDYLAGWSAWSDSPPVASPRARAAMAAALPRMQRDAVLVTAPLGGGGASVGADACVRFSVLLPAHGVALVELPNLVAIAEEEKV